MIFLKYLLNLFMYYLYNWLYLYLCRVCEMEVIKVFFWVYVKYNMCWCVFAFVIYIYDFIVIYDSCRKLYYLNNKR